MKNYLIFVLILQIVYQKNSVLAENANPITTTESVSTDSVDNSLVVLHLDDNTNRILFDLFVELFGNNPNNNTNNNQIEVPVTTVAEIYRNYTQEQIDSLRHELKKLDNSFDIIRKRVDSLQQKFLIANIEYALNRDLSQYEKQFVQIGEQLLTLQKLCLKFTNNDKPIDETNYANERSSRKSTVATIFDRLAGLLLGINTDQSSNQQNNEPLNSNQLNKIITLMRALQTVKSNGKLKTRTDLVKLQTMLYRLQQIHALNRLANQRIYQSSPNMNPYRYEAILNLVKLVGTASGQNQLQTIFRLFTSPQTVNRVKNTNNVSQEKLKILMKAIEEQETRRRQELENQRQKAILEELLRNQNRQQEQINNLIKLIESQNQNQNQNNINNNNINNNIKPTTTQNTPVSDQNQILSKLREQRRQLNNLLKTLGSDFNNNNESTNTEMPVMSGQTNNLGKTQETFSNILKTIGPMMGMLAQSGLISPKQNQLSQKSLTELLNQSKYQNRIQYDSYKSNVSKFVDLLGSILS